jgi:hypothetical protein
MKFAKKWPPSDKGEAGYRMSPVSSHVCARERIELVESGRGLIYSPVWPWIFAMVLSMALWAIFGWFVLRF